MLDRQIGRSHDDEGADENDGDVDAVRHGPLQEVARMPRRLRVSEPREGERYAGNGGDAVGEERQRPNQLLGADMNCGAILGADNLERIEQPVDERVRDPDGYRSDHECQNDDADRGVGEGGHLSAGSIATKARTHETTSIFFVFSRFRG